MSLHGDGIMDDLIQVPFHRALHRSNLIWGGDRKAMIFTLFLVVIMILPAMNIVSIIVGLTFGAIVIYALRQMAKADSKMMAIFYRQYKYEDYYPANSRPSRISKNPRVY
jgi:type IV secretory pathway TrbD component